MLYRPCPGRRAWPPGAPNRGADILRLVDRPDFVEAADAPVLLDNPVIRSIAEAHDRTSAQVLLAWQVQRGTSAVPKTISPARLRENLTAAELQLSEAEMQRIAALDRGDRLIAGAFWVVPGTPWTLETIWDAPFVAAPSGGE